MKFLVVITLVAVTSILSVDSKGRIINGKTAPALLFNYQVHLTIEFEDVTTTCGGSLIDKEWVLTAAHCFEDSPTEIVKVELGNTQSNKQIRYGLGVIIHEGYLSNDNNIRNDIALVKIPSANLNAYVRVIKLSEQTAFANQNVTISGYGVTEDGGTENSSTLQYTTVELMDWDTCREKFGSIFEKNALCTFPVAGSTTCIGDSGGPLVIGFGETAEQIGLVSYGTEECAAYSETAYTETSSFIPWIKFKTRLSF